MVYQILLIFTSFSHSWITSRSQFQVQSFCACDFKPFVLSLAPPCGVPADKFRGFVEQHPEFAEDFLYMENAGLHSAPCHHHQTSPSSPTLQATATTKTANGICPDFSPNDHSMTDGLLKKHNWKSFKILDVEIRLLSWWEGVLCLFLWRGEGVVMFEQKGTICQ